MPVISTEVPASPPPTETVTPIGEAAAQPAVDQPAISLSNKSQTKNLIKANKLYLNKAYSEAIPYYEKVLAAYKTNKAVLSRLGDCYRLTNNTGGQLVCYGGLVNMGSAEAIEELYYGQALVENGEPEKAKPYFEKYSTDARGKELASSLSKWSSYKKNADAYGLFLAPFNSTESDFNAVKFYDAVIFASTRNKTVWIKKNQAWTNGNYIGLYAYKQEDETAPKLFMNDMESRFNDGPISFSKDFNTVYITRNNSRKEEKASDGTYKLKLLEASLDQNGFNRVKIMPFNDNNFNYAHPSISLDGYTLYFSSDRPGGKGGMDIYYTRKDSNGVWGAPVNIGEPINTAGNDVFPFIAANGSFYFSSNGHDGMGGLDIYEAKLSNGKPAGKVYDMGEPINSKDDDFGIFLNEDCKTGYISSNRKAGGLDDDVYILQINKDVKRGKEAIIVVKDKENGLPIDSAKVVINGDTVLTNNKGEYSLGLEDEKEYRIQTSKADYFSKEDTITANSSSEDTFTKEVVIEKDPKLFLRALITDAKTNELLEGVSIKLTDIAASAEVDNYVTTSSGDYFKFLYGKRLGDKLTYLIRLEKQGYLERTVIFSHVIDKPGEINMNQSLNLALGKVEVGMDLAKMIDIKPIYFDLGKSDIRKDAADELDKIVQVMNEYPNMFIELGSHTDCRSSAESNMKLSTARAKASTDYIVNKGINKMRITGRGYGESKLLNNCACEGKVKSDCPEEEHTKNRRTEFLITRLK
jgi:outer membrane protein OmpA-like peptidoglycan-associated protein/tetratricopeptide (TPR) repeat protein